MTMKTYLITLPSCFVAATLFTSCVDPYPVSPSVGYRTGYEVRTLPPGAYTETVHGTRYYSHRGTYYRPSNGRYVVVDPPHASPRVRTVYVDRLPPGHRVKRYSGRDYYVVGETYYRPRGSGYIVVDRPF